jgi:hypothetical protein
MADQHLPGYDEFEGDARFQRLLCYLAEKPLAMPPAHAVARAKALMPTPRQRGPGPVQQAAECIARLIFDSRQAPAMVGFRGTAGDAHLVYASDVGEIDIQIQQPGAEEHPVRIMAQIETDQMHGSARLCRPDRSIVAEAAVDDRGMFTLEAPAGCYELSITLDGNTVRVPALDL